MAFQFWNAANCKLSFADDRKIKAPGKRAHPSLHHLPAVMSPEGPVYSGPTNIYLAYPVQVQYIETIKILKKKSKIVRMQTHLFILSLVHKLPWPQRPIRVRTVEATSLSPSTGQTIPLAWAPATAPPAVTQAPASARPPTPLPTQVSHKLSESSKGCPPAVSIGPQCKLTISISANTTANWTGIDMWQRNNFARGFSC